MNADDVALGAGFRLVLAACGRASGPEGVRFYTKQKMVTSRWPTGIRTGAEYVMPVMR